MIVNDVSRENFSVDSNVFGTNAGMYARNLPEGGAGTMQFRSLTDFNRLRIVFP